MISHFVRRAAGVLVVAALAAHSGVAAETPRSKTEPGKASVSPSSRSAATKGGSSRGPLPDPVLLDGSTLPVEKKSEHGMIGDFELPGDDSRTGKVGGMNPGLPAQGGGPPSPAGGAGLPPPSGGAGQPSSPQAGGPQAPGGQSGPQGGAQGGQQGPGGGGEPIAGGGDPNAQAQGTQVAELGGDAGGQSAGPAGGGPGEKPKQVGIGDSAMRIEPSASGAVGGQQQQQQPAGHTQQHEKGTGSGGKGAGGASGGNRVEKGRVIPSGL